MITIQTLSLFLGIFYQFQLETVPMKAYKDTVSSIHWLSMPKTERDMTKTCLNISRETCLLFFLLLNVLERTHYVTVM